ARVPAARLYMIASYLQQHAHTHPDLHSFPTRRSSDLPVNIGNPREMTIKQFAEEIIRITGARSTIDYKPLPVDDPKVRQPDISRAKKVLDWEPKVRFEEGIKKTIEYFRNALKGAGSN